MLGEGIKAYDKRVAAHKPLLVGKALLIRPQPGTLHWIACLFTSRHYGRRKDEPVKMFFFIKSRYLTQF